MAELDQITVSTKRYIRETPKLIDMVFQEGPLVAYAKQTNKEVFTGGRFIGENFWYNGLIGGPYLAGAEFDITEPQVEQELQFNIKYFETNITFLKEEIQVINKGANMAFSLVESRTQNAYTTMGAFQEIAMYLPGINANYTANFNGLPEALNDNATVSWNNVLYPQYGTITRGGAVGTVLNSAPTDVNGTIQYNTLEETYGNASFGQLEPNLGVTTAFGYSFIKEKFQTQQRFNDTQDPKIGFNGLKFNNATLIRSRYAPGAYLFGSSGTADSVAVQFMKTMSKGALTAYPAPVGGYPAAGSYSETLWWLNAKKPYMNFYISDDPEFGYGFTGFKPAQGNTKVAGQVLFAGAATWAPRYHRQLYRITG
jgi:hypothetical protein